MLVNIVLVLIPFLAVGIGLMLQNEVLTILVGGVLVLTAVILEGCDTKKGRYVLAGVLLPFLVAYIVVQF